MDKLRIVPLLVDRLPATNRDDALRTEALKPATGHYVYGASPFRQTDAINAFLLRVLDGPGRDVTKTS